MYFCTFFQVVAVDMNRYYLNEEEPVGGGEFTADISFMRTFANIFAKEEQAILKVGGCQCLLSQCLFIVYVYTYMLRMY